GANWVLVGTDTITMAAGVYIGLAVTAHNNAALSASTFDNVAIRSQWTSQDIGSVGIIGSSTYNGSSFTVNGSGTDIWNAADAFQFMYQPLIGDGQIVARVASQQNTDPWAKAGVMIRETLTAGSKNAMMAITPGNGLDFQFRSDAGISSTYSFGGNATVPIWVKLVRNGTTISAYKSTDGVAWTLVGSTSITMNNSLYVGLAVTSHNNSVLNTSTFDNVNAP
ncbi:MAG: silent information regulator protein Sir2, partial [Acidobacteria bacterium]